MDNLNIHRRKPLLNPYGAELGTEIWSRWLNQAEIGIFGRQCLGGRRISDLKMLHRETRAWNRRINRSGTSINWKFDRKTARRKFRDQWQSFRRSEN
jgi:hypothetical protein